MGSQLCRNVLFTEYRRLPGTALCRPQQYNGFLDSRLFIRRAVEPAARRAGSKEASRHTLRHATASRRALASVDLYRFNELLGASKHRDEGEIPSLRRVFCAMRPIEAGCSPSGEILQSKLESRERSGVGGCTSLARFANYQCCGAPGWNRTNDPRLRRPTRSQ